MKSQMDVLVKRVQTSENYNRLRDMFDSDHPGLGEKIDLMHACVGLAGALAEDHPDLSSTPRIITDLALSLFAAQQGPSVVELPPEGESGEE